MNITSYLGDSDRTTEVSWKRWWYLFSLEGSEISDTEPGEFCSSSWHMPIDDFLQ
jgi:hypothetical protein